MLAVAPQRCLTLSILTSLIGGAVCWFAGTPFSLLALVHFVPPCARPSGLAAPCVVGDRGSGIAFQAGYSSRFSRRKSEGWVWG
jgi:hypothetical protein